MLTKLITTLTAAGLMLLAASERPSKPNFVFIMVDDLGWQDVACYNVQKEPIFETPYMDALREDGIQFWQAYSPSCVCAPSRASALSGKHPARLGITSVGGGVCPAPYGPNGRMIAPHTDLCLQLEEDTIAELLAPEGYYNGHVGKWHIIGKLGKEKPTAQGFHWTRENRGIHEFGSVAGWAEKMRSHPRVPFGTSAPNDPYKLDKNGFAHDENTQDALDFMDEAVEKESPFFCFYAPYIVHAPNLSRTESLLKKYSEKMGYDYPLTGEEEFPPGQTNPHYAAMVETFDYNVHQIVSYLKETDDPRWVGHKLIENTYVFITSDNGGMVWDQENATSNLPLSKGKIHQQEGGIRVPFLILGPEVKQGIESDVVINCYDLVPTMLGLAGLELPTDLDGCDLTALITQDPTDAGLVTHVDGSIRESMIWHFPHSGALNSAIRKGRWKLFHNYDYRDNPHLTQYTLYELYDESGQPVDITEQNNVSEQHPALVQELVAELRTQLNDMGAYAAYRNPKTTMPLADKEEVPVVLKDGREGELVWAEYETGKSAVKDAMLIYTYNGGTPREDWFSKRAQITSAGRVEARLPDNVTHYVFNLIDENDFLISYPEVGPMGKVLNSSVALSTNE